MASHKKQHYIPESYLKAWCDPDSPEGFEPYIWVISKDGADIRRKAPSNVFHQSDLYTIEESKGRKLDVESGLATIENSFTAVRTKKLNAHAPLSPRDRIVITGFAAAMHSRTLASGERWQPFWQEVSDKAKQMAEWAAKATPGELHSAAHAPVLGSDSSFSVSQSQLQAYADTPLKYLVPAGVSVLPPMLMQLDLAILVTATQPGFITSDDPYVWGDEPSSRRSYIAGPSLMSPTIEILLPVSPSQCLFFNRQGKNGYIFLPEHGPLAESRVVMDTNRRIRLNARRFFVVNKPILLVKWFTP